MAYYFLYIQYLCRDVHIIKISMRLVFVDQNSELHVYKYEKKDTSLVRNVTQLLKNARIISRFFTRLIGHVAGFTRSSTTKQGLRWIRLTHNANLPLNPLARLCCVWVFFLVPVVLTTLYKFFTSAGNWNCVSVPILSQCKRVVKATNIHWLLYSPKTCPKMSFSSSTMKDFLTIFSFWKSLLQKSMLFFISISLPFHY